MYISNLHKMKTDTSKKVSCLHYPTCAFSKNKWIKKIPKSFFFPLSDTRLFQLAGANVEGRPRCFFWLRGKRGKIAAHRTSRYIIDTWKTHQSINQYYDIHKTVNKGFFGVRNFWGLYFRILRIKFPGFLSHFWQGIRTSFWVVIWFCLLTNFSDIFSNIFLKSPEFSVLSQNK